MTTALEPEVWMLDDTDEPITGPYPELARIVRNVKGERSFQVLQRLSGVNRNSIYNMSHGDRASMPLTIKFADAFGIPRNEILSASGYPTEAAPDVAKTSANTGEITYELDLSLLPVPEGYRDLDDDGRAFVSESLRIAVEKALRAQRRNNIGRRPDEEEDQKDTDEDADYIPFD